MQIINEWRYKDKEIGSDMYVIKMVEDIADDKIIEENRIESRQKIY